jgi:AraC-like DNA-binding protein
MLHMVASYIGASLSECLRSARAGDFLSAGAEDCAGPALSLHGDRDAACSYPVRLEKQLLSAISEGDADRSLDTLGRILARFLAACRDDLELFRTRALERVVLRSRAWVDGGADAGQILDLNQRYILEVKRLRSVEEVVRWLSDITALYARYVFDFASVKHADIIFKAVDFIRRNYMRKLSLEEVAEHVHLSRPISAGVFKAEMHCNFNAYLTNLRIEKSKKLLLSPSVSLSEIPELVGFEGTSYFSKVFKKTTGSTPAVTRASAAGSARPPPNGRSGPAGYGAAAVLTNSPAN